ncbi:MAG: biopolymer transporter ExbD [Muribaculaceae bacterium]|jgi:biopolymer transport protein ExbD|nr:biopolymer transporter ExbD [Muribaculaceae bacterium]
MALKKQYSSLATFSMSSMTDVIFLLLIFFMVTSTLINPAAIEVDLPQSSEQTSLKPVTEVYMDSLTNLYVVENRHDSVAEKATPRPVSLQELMAALTLIQQQDSLRAVALYADTKVEYGKVMEILDVAARRNLKMVLATKSSQRVQDAEKEILAGDASAMPAENQ